jgi:cysteine desulfurase / selenocysteine lyase
VSYDVAALRRAEFPWAVDGETIYLNNASTGPLPERTVRVLDEWNRLRANPERISHDLQFATLARGRELIARLIGADAGEIALATNTSFGINLAAFSLPLRAGDVVVSPDREFPANVYPWMQLAKRRGIEYRRVACPDGVLDSGTLARVLDDARVRVVTVSWVQFASGARVDLATLGAMCRERGVYFVVDAIQGLGPLTIDLQTTPVDIFACGAQKWLLSPWGAAFVYVRRPLIDQLEPHDVSWLAVRSADDFSRLTDYELAWRSDARRFEFITLPYQDVAGMNESLELLHELGPPAVAEHASRLADEIIDWAAGRDDVRLVTPRDGSRHAAIVSLQPADAARASARLTRDGITHSLREGAIRLSPHCYNTSAEVRQALSVMAG